MARDEQHRLEMGARIKELRAIHGFKQQYIADQIDVDKRTYQMWQAGQTEPNQEHLEKLAALFGVTPTFILRGETPDPLSSRSDQLDQIEAMLRALDEQVRLMRGETAARDAEVLKRLDEGLPPTHQSRPPRRR